MDFYNRHLKIESKTLCLEVMLVKALNSLAKAMAKLPLKRQHYYHGKKSLLTLLVSGLYKSALTMIDMVTNLVKVIQIDNKTSALAALHF
jgi:hypothetical protein